MQGSLIVKILRLPPPELQNGKCLPYKRELPSDHGAAEELYIQKGKALKKISIRFEESSRVVGILYAQSLAQSHYMTTHLLFSLSEAVFTDKATLAASVKASLTPLFLLAEHSVANLAKPCQTDDRSLPKYRNACILLATSKPRA